MGKIKVIGVGPGHIDYVLPVAMDAICQSDVLVGAERNLETFRHLEKRVFVYKRNLKEMLEFIRINRKTQSIAVVVSGDTGFYSLLNYLQRQLPEENFDVIPGISSYQYLYAKVGKTYKNHGLYSIHGKAFDVKEALSNHEGIFLLTDKENTPQTIAKQLINETSENYYMIVGESLSYDDEKITQGTPEEISQIKFDTLSVLIIERVAN